ncbi:MAG: ABC transporter permease [Firmicutes bacterium]|nr:ABC transporter permease [Bacillota bacterium]
MNNMISSQLFKTRKSNVWPIVLCCSLVLDMIPFIAHKYIGNISLKQDFFDGDFTIITIGVLAALLFTMDFTSDSIKQIVGKRASKTKYVIANHLVVTMSTFLMFAILIGVSILYSIIFGIGVDEYVDFNSQKDFFIAFAGLAAVAFAYISFVMLIAFLSNKLSVTLILSIVAPPILRGLIAIVSGIHPKLALISPQNALYYLAYTPYSETYLSVIIGYFLAGIVLCGVSIAIFRKKEL